MAQSRPATPASPAPCPCGSPRFDQCCGPILAGAPAPNAESLMRSRYCAYTQGNEAYLRATWHSTTRPKDAIIDPTEKLQWLGLEVKSDLRLRKRKDAEAISVQAAAQAATSHDLADTRAWATVEFVARYKINGRAQRLHEISRFVCEMEADGPRWYYVDGSFPKK